MHAPRSNDPTAAARLHPTTTTDAAERPAPRPAGSGASAAGYTEGDVKAHVQRLTGFMMMSFLAMTLAQFIEAISNRGYVQMNRGDFESAENDFTQSLTLNAAQPSVLSLRAGSKLSRGDVEAAIADYRDVLKWDSKNSYGHAELGFALYFAGKTQESLAEFDKVTEIDPKLRFVLPWRYLAMLSLGQKQQADAKFAADLTIAKEKREWPDQLLIYLGDKQSEQDLRKSINNQDAKAADAQICEAEFFVGQRKFVAGQKDAAKVHFAAALKSKSTQLSAYRGAKLAVK